MHKWNSWHNWGFYIGSSIIMELGKSIRNWHIVSHHLVTFQSVMIVITRRTILQLNTVAKQSNWSNSEDNSRVKTTNRMSRSTKLSGMKEFRKEIPAVNIFLTSNLMLQCYIIRNLLEIYLLRKSFLNDGFEKQFNLSDFFFLSYCSIIRSIC